MTCDECAEVLGDAVDGTLTGAAEAALREHIGQCEACAALLSDLHAIRRSAAALDRHKPSPDLWQTISARTAEPRRSWSWMPLAAAAVLAIAIGSTAWLYVSRTQSARVPAEAEAHDLATSAESEIQQAEAHYDKAIAALEQLTAGKEQTLDPRVAEAIAASLHTVDQAIVDSRAALKTDPASAVAQASVLEALRAKVSLLRETVSLINATS